MGRALGARDGHNVSGIAIAHQLARSLLDGPAPQRTHRFLFASGTLGAIAWVEHHREQAVPHARAGLVLTRLGDDSPPSYKVSRRGGTLVDRAVQHVLQHAGLGSRLLPFTPYGYDERQFCSPGFDLPVARLGRGVHGEYPKHHTSADDLSFVTARRLAESDEILRAVVHVLERDRLVVNQAPFGEPQLGRRGLYRDTGATPLDRRSTEMALLWVLNLCDGTRSLLDVAERAELPFGVVDLAAVRLEKAGLLHGATGRSCWLPAGESVSVPVWRSSGSTWTGDVRSIASSARRRRRGLHGARPTGRCALGRAAGADATVCVLPMTEVVQVVRAGQIVSVLPKDGQVLAQSPAAFRAGVLRAAHATPSRATADRLGGYGLWTGWAQGVGHTGRLTR